MFVDLADIIKAIKIETLGQLCHVVSVAIVLSTFKAWIQRMMERRINQTVD